MLHPTFPISHILILFLKYLHAYNSHTLKDVYDVHGLDLRGVAKSFGFDNPPKVTLMLKPNQKEGGSRKAGARAQNQNRAGAGFSAANPYGKRQAAGAKRQVAK